MRTLAFVIVAMQLLAPSLRAEASLTAAEIKTIVEKPHNPTLKLDELKDLPHGRKMDMRLKVIDAEGQTHEPDVIRVDEKFVDGIYIVDTFSLPGVERPFHIITSFDPKAGVYRKWVLRPNDQVVDMFGIRDRNARTMSWSSVMNVDGKTVLSVGQDTFGDKGGKNVSWTEAVIVDGKVVQRIIGEATIVE